MTSRNEYETLDEEVKELLLNYKLKKATIYEPCTRNNYKECLIGLMEELSLLNITYIFNPHTDLENNILTTDSLVKLINSVWTLLHYHKNSLEKAEQLSEQNHIFEQNNKQLHAIVKTLNGKLYLEKNEAKACVASAQRVSDKSDEIYNTLAETRAKLTQVTKQKETTEKALHNKITKLKLENDKLQDRLRNKSATHLSCTDICDSTITRLKERERKQRAVISKLQANNAELLREVIAMKEEIILNGIQDFKLDQNANSQ